MTRKSAWRITALLLVLLFILPLFVSCKTKLMLSKSVDARAISAPLLRGTRYAQNLNARLLDLYDPLLRSVSALNSSGLDVALQYELLETKTSTVLKTSLVGRGTAASVKSLEMMNKGTVSLPDIQIGENGEISGAERFEAEMLKDKDYLKALLLLSALGVTVDITQRENEATERSIAQYAVSLYEYFRANEIDIQNRLSDITDALSAKAYAINLFTYYEGMPAIEATPVFPAYFYSAVDDYQNSLYSLLYTDSGRLATVSDAVQILELMIAPTGLLESQSVSQILSNFDSKSRDTLTRETWASLCRTCFEALVETPEDGYAYHPVEDSKAADVKFVLGYDLVQAYPAYDTYMPRQSVRLYQLSQLGAYFAASLCGWVQSTEEPMLGQAYTVRQAVRYFAGVAAYCLDARGAKDTTVRVVNDRPYSFYFRQADTGKYSAVNCMPTLVSMCLKWQNESFVKTPQQIRASADPKGTGGWTLFMAEKALKENGARYEQWTLSYDDAEVNIQKMMSELDRGCVLYCMINEGDLGNDGHCMLVYGYKKSGDSVWFSVYDPGLGTATDIFGKPLGQTRSLEAHYAQWITQRWAYAVLSILP